jgi:hypothetical protein
MRPSVGAGRFSLQILKDICAGAVLRIDVTYSLGELVQSLAIVSDSPVSAPFLYLPVEKILTELGNGWFGLLVRQVGSPDIQKQLRRVKLRFADQTQHVLFFDGQLRKLD